jgi:hypothetical protein
MKLSRSSYATGLVCALLPLYASGQQTPTLAGGRVPQAPPTAPPIVVREAGPQLFRAFQPPEGVTAYSIGAPTDEEQQYLEYLNRARANPPAEGVILATTTDPDILAAYSYFGVDLVLMQTQFNAIATSPPLAMNAQLTAAARSHSVDMFTNQFQSHTGTDGSNPGTRISAQGYNWQTYGENIYAYAENVFFGHAGFEVDWGVGTGGMQVPPGHRNNIHNAAFREVGVGVVNGVNGSVGPQLVTQDLGTRLSATPFITGVVYYDINGNGFYDIGEGLGGVTVQVPGSAYYATTATSGGYAVPVTTNGQYDVIFSAPGMPTNQVIATVAGLANVKVDDILSYSAPVLSGPNPAALNADNGYNFTSVGGATNYQWELTALPPYTTVDGAENGTNGVTIVQSAGYSVLASDVKASGSYSFHLCQPVATAQRVTLNPTIRPHANSAISFAKRLGYAGGAQIARAQVSTNSGGSWQDVWNQTGSGGSGEAGFTRITNSLAAYANMNLAVRFVYDFVGGSYYPQTGSGFGLYLDDIAISNADEPQPPTTNFTASASSLTFHPANTNDYSLRVRALLPGRTFDWGPAFRVSVANLPPITIQFTGTPVRSGNQFQADFTVANYLSGTTFELLKTTDLNGAWVADPTAVIQTLVPNTQFRVTTTDTNTRAFFQIRAN